MVASQVRAVHDSADSVVPVAMAVTAAARRASVTAIDPDKVAAAIAPVKGKVRVAVLVPAAAASAVDSRLMRHKPRRR
jgi:hypothetical protein